MRSFVRDSRSRRLGSIAVDERRDVAKDWDRCRTRGKNWTRHVARSRSATLRSRARESRDAAGM